MKYNGVRYIITYRELGKREPQRVVSDSSSEACEDYEISDEERIKRLEIADDIFYIEGNIKEVIIKTTDGKRWVTTG